MLRSCPYCGKIHENAKQCEQKPKRQKQGAREAEKFRSTNAWARKRAEVGERDHYLCRVCLEDEHCITYDGIEAHHIIPLEETIEYALDADWIIDLCVKHHRQAERGEISRDRLHAMAMAPVSPLPLELG